MSEQAPEVRKTERRHRSPHGPGLFITDGELIALMGVPPDVARSRLAEMDQKPTVYSFPPKQKVWGDRRYRPAVEAWFEAQYRLKINTSKLREVS